MAHENTNQSVFRHIDWITLVIYLLLVCAGALSIYAATYDFDFASIFDFKEFSGKQIRWIGLSLCLGMVLLLIDVRVYENYAYIIYGALLLLLLLTIFIAPNIKGSHSWLVLGPLSLQPAEFGKCATALALAKLFSGYNFTLNASRTNYLKALLIITLPILLILAQNETGSALVYMSLFFVLYREGMSGLILMAAALAVIIFVVAVKYSDTTTMGIPTGEAAVFIILMILLTGMLAIYARRPDAARHTALWFTATGLIAWILSLFNLHINGTYFFSIVLGIATAYATVLLLQTKTRRLAITITTTIAAVTFLYSSDYAFHHILQPHQQKRIEVALGMVEDLRGDGYNVNQSKIAIGSGGFAGKGFLNGTQTKLKYVPEQHTDFIFCTIGEEEGFLGAATVVILFTALILRIITLAERQPNAFGRVYAYCVASYLIFHLCINVGMVLGLVPVIGIPLPFFSYGGSSLWGFTFLLFILLRIDAARRDRPSY